MNKKSKLQALEDMLLIRGFEERMLKLDNAGEVPGPLHLSIGQEAVAVGAVGALEDRDYIVSTHRGHHHCIAKGIPLARTVAELLGRKDGWARGRGGSMHLIAPDSGILGTNGIVGGGLPIGVGAGYAMQASGRDSVVMVFFGEGASSTGAFGEALNMASLWDLPVIFICENNQYVEFGSHEDHVAGTVSKRAAGYDMPGTEVDGNDVVAVRRVASKAIDRARSGKGPTLIEALTYRWYGHHSKDRADYQPDSEIEQWKTERDPISRLVNQTDADLDQVKAGVDVILDAAFAEGEASEPVGLESITKDTLA